MFDVDVEPSVEQFSLVEHNVTVQCTLHRPFKPNFRREYVVYDFLEIFMHTHDHFHANFRPIVNNLDHLKISFIDHMDFFNEHFVMQIVQCLKVILDSNILHFLTHHFVYFRFL